MSENSRQFEIVIVNNGSHDRTGVIAEDLAKQYKNIRVIHHPRNMGYGGALKTGFASARGDYDYVMYLDSDNQYDINEFNPHLHLLDQFDILSPYAAKKAVTFPRKIQSFVYNFCLNNLFPLKLRDVNCSMKIYKREVIKTVSINSQSAFIDAEVLLKAKRAGFKIHQFPITHFPRKKGVATGSHPSVIWETIKEMVKFRLWS